MRYGSVCSGIEAASAAWHPLGWESAFNSEIEAFPRAVLKHHYPDVPLHGDFTTIEEKDYGSIRLLVGGTPCQSFSVAGLRGGMDDHRGNLSLEFLKLAQRLRPTWLVWENVPGVLSSNGGRDFGSILGGMVKLGYGFAYRVLDAQYFGVPQRRRRVFVVGYLGDWRPPAAVLFERQSLQGHPAPSREKGERIADSLTVGANQYSGFCGEPVEVVQPFDVASGLDASYGKHYGQDNQHIDNGASMFVMSSGQANAEIDTDKSSALNCNRDGAPIVFTHIDGEDGDPSFTLQAGQKHAVAYSIMPMNSGKDYKARETNISQPIMAGGPTGGNQGGDYVAHPVAFAQNSRDELREMPYAGALAAEPGMKQQSYIRNNMQVRRLTPVECSRLQGFPDYYTRIPWRGKPAKDCPDGPQYKALGNSMAVPVMRWIGERIQQVEDML